MALKPQNLQWNMPLLVWDTVILQYVSHNNGFINGRKYIIYICLLLILNFEVSVLPLREIYYLAIHRVFYHGSILWCFGPILFFMYRVHTRFVHFQDYLKVSDLACHAAAYYRHVWILLFQTNLRLRSALCYILFKLTCRYFSRTLLLVALEMLKLASLIFTYAL